MIMRCCYDVQRYIHTLQDILYGCIQSKCTWNDYNNHFILTVLAYSVLQETTQ